MQLQELLHSAVSQGASDIFIVAGAAVTFKIQNVLKAVEQTVLNPVLTKAYIDEMYTLSTHPHTQDRLLQKGDDDFSISIPGLARFRVNVYTQRASFAAVLRIVQFEIPTPKAMHIPDEILRFSKQRKGLVIFSGPAGCGKSTTLAILLDQINKSTKGHIVTIEDPIEFLHRHQQSIVSQREINSDCENSASALRAALRQAPDVIFVGEMRDLETISLALTAAETGHLVFSTLHTLGAANTIDRIIDVFPPSQQQQIRVQLSMVLQAVISQQLVPTVHSSLYPIFEVMVNTPAIRNQIREGKTHHLNNTISASIDENMMSMDSMLATVVKSGEVEFTQAMKYAFDPSNFQSRLKD